MKIGLIGCMGSGKTTVSKILWEEGFGIVDCYKIVNELIHEPVIERPLIKAFGDSIIDSDGKICPTALRERAEAEPQAMKMLRFVLKKEINIRLGRQLSSSNLQVVNSFEVSTVPLPLQEVWMVSCDEKTRCERACHKYHKEALSQKINGISIAPDVIIDNSGTIEDTERQVRLEVRRLKKQLTAARYSLK